MKQKGGYDECAIASLQYGRNYIITSKSSASIGLMTDRGLFLFVLLNEFVGPFVAQLLGLLQGC